VGPASQIGEAASGSMWALHPSLKQPTKLIVSLPTFSGRAHLPTHALHCYVQEDKQNKAPDRARFGGGWGGGSSK
jgi:hypothetical protein